jgi:LysM repeat protein
VRKATKGQTLKIVTYKRVPVPKQSAPAENTESHSESAEMLADNAAADNTQESRHSKANKHEETSQPQETRPAKDKTPATKNKRNSVKEEPVADNSSSSSSKKSRNKKKAEEPVTVTVKKGENLTKIAKRNGLTVDQLKKLNNIQDNKIKTGQKLRVK